MNNLKIFFFLLIPLFISCIDIKVKLPIETSLGNLVTIEQKDMVETSGGKITPKSEEVLYLLIFEGKSEIPFNVTVQTTDIQRAIPFILESIREYAPLIVDQETYNQYTPVFTGSPDTIGIISPNGWGIDGDVKNYNWKGKLTMQESRIALVYLIPKTAVKLILKDGEQVFQTK
jgi:hypothetical protein